MPTEQKISLNPDIKKLAIIAGRGAIPAQLREACQKRGIKTYLIGLKGNTDIEDADLSVRIGQAGKAIQYLKVHDVTDIVMIGAVKKPGLMDFYFDRITPIFFLKCWIRSWGDSSILSAARTELETMGFKLHGVHKFLPDLLMPEGALGEIKADQYQADIKLGVEAARKLGEADIGQAVIVKDDQIIARETQKGTSALIKKHGCAGAVLVKMCKPQQDRDLDLPTIGVQTAALCVQKKMRGIVGQAGATLLVERDEVMSIANENGLFVLGVSVDE